MTCYNFVGQMLVTKSEQRPSSMACMQVYNRCNKAARNGTQGQSRCTWWDRIPVISSSNCIQTTAHTFQTWCHESMDEPRAEQFNPRLDEKLVFFVFCLDLYNFENYLELVSWGLILATWTQFRRDPRGEAWDRAGRWIESANMSLNVNMLWQNRMFVHTIIPGCNSSSLDRFWLLPSAVPGERQRRLGECHSERQLLESGRQSDRQMDKV